MCCLAFLFAEAFPTFFCEPPTSQRNTILPGNGVCCGEFEVLTGQILFISFRQLNAVQHCVFICGDQIKAVSGWTIVMTAHLRSYRARLSSPGGCTSIRACAAFWCHSLPQASHALILEFLSILLGFWKCVTKRDFLPIIMPFNTFLIRQAVIDHSFF